MGRASGMCRFPAASEGSARRQRRPGPGYPTPTASSVCGNESVEGRYFVQIVNELHQVVGLKGRNLFVELSRTEHITQLVEELGHQPIQLKKRSEEGVRGHERVPSANDGEYETKGKRGKGEVTSLPVFGARGGPITVFLVTGVDTLGEHASSAPVIISFRASSRQIGTRARTLPREPSLSEQPLIINTQHSRAGP